MSQMPVWDVPSNIAAVIADGEGIWQDERWLPILLTAMSGTELAGREIPIAWQIEFDPSAEELESANARLEDLDMEPDGYGWGAYIQKVLRKSDPALAKRLHTADCETDTCVIWVESETDCRALLEATWKLIFAD